ncbi:NUDIX domain-containing protein [Roseomonas sp. ACRSG]|nr:NUDIX domain-containing protein [Roseomonas sp. ACRSG]
MPPEAPRPMEEKSGIRIQSREVLSENWFRLEKVTFDQRRADGSEQRLQREVYHNGPGAAVLPVDAERGTVLLVRQLRIPALVNGDGPMLIEACAGMVEKGDDPARTVLQEAEQEMGCRLQGLRKVLELYTSPGASAEKLHLFLARYTQDDRTGQGGGLAGEGEQIEVLEMPLSQAWAMVESGEIIDAKTVILLQHARLAGGGF